MTSLPFRSLLAMSAATLPLAFGGAAAHAATTDGSTVAVGSAVAVTFYLPVRNEALAEAQAVALQTPGSPSYHKFLGVSDFVSKYGATSAQISSVEASLKKMGYTVSYVYANHLAIEATATAAVVDSTLSVNLKNYTFHGRTGMSPDKAPTIPAELQGSVTAVAGLDTLMHPTSHRVHASFTTAAMSANATKISPSGVLVASGPGTYLPADYEKFYDVTPILSQGVSGRGSTIGIVTLADFYTSDAYAFWKQIGLNVSQSRITKVAVDGGVGTVSDALGEGETDIDVEESGAIAPDANLRVYVAPNNTNADFINGFEAAASENIADTVSTSWGEPEVFYFYEIATHTPADNADLQAFHGVFLEMALQGQTVYVASGDSGAFDTVEDCPNSDIYGSPSADNPVCNAPYAVDSPSDDPLVTAAGGTTLPFNFDITLSADDATVDLYVTKERAWSWDYIAAEAAEQGQGSELPVEDLFSTGDGGGVSGYWTRPWYQDFTSGVKLTKPGQTLTEDTGSGPVLQYTIPSNFPGRNMPDISTNADPESGYQYIEEGTDVAGYGGTSFVAPQLNGVTALLTEALGGRVGQINPALYTLGNVATPDVAAGNNWGWNAVSGYDQATGVGKLDGAKLLTWLKVLKKL